MIAGAALIEARWLRLGLVLVLLIGLLMPRLGAPLAELSGAERVVICRGAELVTVTLGPDGTPVETEAADHGPCLCVSPTPAAVRPAVPWQRLAVAPDRPLPVLQPTRWRAPWIGPPPDRGPPLSA